MPMKRSRLGRGLDHTMGEGERDSRSTRRSGTLRRRRAAAAAAAESTGGLELALGVTPGTTIGPREVRYIWVPSTEQMELKVQKAMLEQMDLTVLKVQRVT